MSYYKINCEHLTPRGVGKLITQLVNYPVSLDDYDIDVDEDGMYFDDNMDVCYDVTEFFIDMNNYEDLDTVKILKITDKIEKVLDAYHVEYYCK